MDIDGRSGRRRLVAAFLFSSLLHGGLLWVLSGEMGRNSLGIVGDFSAPMVEMMAPLQVRLPVLAITTPADAVLTGLTLVDAPSSAAPSLAAETGIVALDPPGEALSVATPIAGDGQGRAQSVEMVGDGFGLVPPGESGPPYPLPDAPYRPAGSCELPPIPLQEYTLDFPELQGLDFASRLIFALLIDERGRVEEVLHESGTLDARLVGGIIERLRGFRFQSALCQGQPAATRLRIEVSFGYALQ